MPERTLIGPPHAHMDAPCTDKCYETASAEPAPQQATCGSCGGTGLVHGGGANGNWTAERCGCDEEPSSEATCHRCGGPNIVWAAPSPLWNVVMRGGSIGGQDKHDGIICPTCFAVLAEAEDLAGRWRLYAESVTPDLETVTPDGRVWDDKAWLWVDPAEPQQPDTSALLDLVRQYGVEEYRHGSAQSNPADGMDVVRRRAEAAQALFDRIAALVPQQPLVSVPLRERDELRAKLAESEISVAAMRATIDTLYALLGVEGAGVEVAVGAIEALKATASPPDPSVLSLPQVPDGHIAVAVADLSIVLNQRSGHSHMRPGVWDDDSSLGLAGKPCVECAARDRLLAALPPPREPRTWPMVAINTPLAPARMPEYVTVQGWGSYGLREDGLYASTDGYPDDVAREHCLTFDALRALGDVTEVFE